MYVILLTKVYRNLANLSALAPQFISAKVKKHLRKSQAQFRKKLRKLRLRQNNDVLIKKTCTSLAHSSLILGSYLRLVVFNTF